MEIKLKLMKYTVRGACKMKCLEYRFFFFSFFRFIFLGIHYCLYHFSTVNKLIEVDSFVTNVESINFISFF